MFRLQLLLFLFAPMILFSSIANADVRYRGFQLGYSSLFESDIVDLNAVHGTNMIRFQITHPDMDDITEAGGEQAYIDLVEGVLDEIDLKITAAEDPTHPQVVVIGFALPPGGFQDRSAVPPHSKMFSSTVFQGWYLNMLERIRTRYQSYIQNGVIYALDINSEPAQNTKLATNGALEWNDLLLEAVSRVRALEDSQFSGLRVPLMVKPLYGDPTKLRNLPCVPDENIVFSYHAYPFNNYQHSCIPGYSCSSGRPNGNAVKNKILNNVAKFYQRQMNLGCVESVDELKMNVGEFAISSCAQEGDLYGRNLIETLEGDELTTQKKKKKKCKGKKKKGKKCKNSGGGGNGGGNNGFQSFKELVKHDSWTFHAYGEADVWDPRFICGSGNEPTFSGDNTPMFEMLREFFGRNETN